MPTPPFRSAETVNVVGKAPPDPEIARRAAGRDAELNLWRLGQLGNANSDQFAASGGVPQGDDPNVYRGPIGASGEKLPVATLDLSEPRDNSPIVPTRKVGQDEHGHLSMVPYNAPNTAYRDDKNQNRIRYWDPNIRWYERAGRALKGALTGPDWGNGILNTGARTVVNKIPYANVPYAIGGAVQGATSRNPVRRNWSPEDAEQAALNGALTDPNRMTPNQATLNAGRTAPTNTYGAPNIGGIPPSMFSSTRGGGDYSDPGYNEGGGGGQSVTPPPASDPNAPAASTSPLPTATTPPPTRTTPPPTGTPTGRQAQPRPTNPENRVNPTTGEPDPNGVLPQHMPGYQPPTYVPFTQEGVASIKALYQKYFGRDPTQGEIDASRANPGGLAAIEAALKGSPHSILRPGAETGTGTGTNPGTAAAQTGAGSGGGGYSYAGFDFGQDPGNRDITKSAKYAFSHFAGQAAAKGIPQPRSKQEAEAWFIANIAPGLNANGFQVHKVVGDKAFISTREFPNGQWVDFQGNSGGQGDQPLTWQAENFGAGSDVDPESIFAVQNNFGTGDDGQSRGMARGPSDLNGILNTGNGQLDSFAARLVQQLLEGAALDDVLERESRTRQGISPENLRAVGF